MLHDRYLYDRSANNWTVDRYLDDLETRYGGIDSVLVWQYYPNSGLDDRNNFDMISNLPGGVIEACSIATLFFLLWLQTSTLLCRWPAYKTW
eukprot:SAG31_NODE_4122_length_3562_cov_4.035230_2_plen_92_part_00